ncbi:hypothetical protein MLD38_015079 [Melastoma candidum]|uniref:Uncharacterized protein n=1 Tax=Melastoma candidum TaxID=119954 RepID=A0ACB9RF16_9MYRT|nr:hypothetical protein MLD38_015079 [Melastoma candidum]
MTMRIGNLSGKGFDQGPGISVSQSARTYPSKQNSNKPHASQSLPKDGELKTKQAAQLLHCAKHLGLQLPEPESSSTQSASRSYQEMSFVDGTNSQGQSQDKSSGRSGEVENKSLFLFGNSEIVFNGSQADQTHPTVWVTYPPAVDPYFSGLLAAYGPQASIQPLGHQGAGFAIPPRVPLPLTLPEDGLIFVNAKQYNGILRRRQSRAKLEARNKLFRARKPYLHESRHRHALNRVRGSGGRFLSIKKLQEPNPSPGNKGDSERESHGRLQARRFSLASPSQA